MQFWKKNVFSTHCLDFRYLFFCLSVSTCMYLHILLVYCVYASLNINRDYRVVRLLICVVLLACSIKQYICVGYSLLVVIYADYLTFTIPTIILPHPLRPSARNLIHEGTIEQATKAHCNYDNSSINFIHLFDRIVHLFHFGRYFVHQNDVGIFVT